MATEAFDQITSDISILGGKPCIRGSRISVEHILEVVAGGASIPDIVSAYPHLKHEQVEQALRYASRFLANEVVIEAEIPH